MQISPFGQAAAKQNTAIGGCPHGVGPGCPQCNGGGGGGGGGATKNTSGLMSWNQAWAVYSALQRNQSQQAEYLKGVNANQARLQQEAFNGMQRGLTGFVNRFLQAAIPLAQMTSQLLTASARVLTSLVQDVQNMLKQVGLQLAKSVDILNVVDKLATILGDQQKLLLDIVQHNIENLKAMLTRLQAAIRMGQITELAEKAMQYLAREVSEFIQSTQERIASIWSGIKRFFQSEEESQPGEPLSLFEQTQKRR